MLQLPAELFALLPPKPRARWSPGLEQVRGSSNAGCVHSKAQGEGRGELKGEPASTRGGQGEQGTGKQQGEDSPGVVKATERI